MQRAHGATTGCMPLRVGLRAGEGVGAVVRGDADGEVALHLAKRGSEPALGFTMLMRNLGYIHRFYKKSLHTQLHTPFL